MKDANTLAHRITELIANGLPGEKAHSKMLPEGRSLTTSSIKRESAVLLLLYPRAGLWTTVFIKRNLYDGPHSGQISIPGGKKDALDKTLLETALRETLEETGVDASNALLHSALSPIHIPVSGFVVYPYLAVLNFSPVFTPDPNEVNYLIEVPLRKLKDPSIVKIRRMMIGDTGVNVPYFDIRDEVIWGATAMILAEFLELMPEIISD